MSPALAGGFSSALPPGESGNSVLSDVSCKYLLPVCGLSDSLNGCFRSCPVEKLTESHADPFYSGQK